MNDFFLLDACMNGDVPTLLELLDDDTSDNIGTSY